MNTHNSIKDIMDL